LIPGARPPVALAGAASTATVHLHLRMNELRKPSRVSGGTITSCRFDPFAARSSNGRYLRIPLKKWVIHCRWGDVVIQ